MLKLKTTVLQKKAIALAVLWCWTSGEAALLASGPASFEALPTGRLMAALGQGEPGEGVQICVEVARRFRKASAVDRSGILAQLAHVLESAPQADARMGAIACLAGLVSSPLDQATLAVIADTMRDVLSLEREPRILSAAIRLIPDVDQGQDALDLLANLLDNRALMQAHPELAREALLSAGRVGPLAVSFLAGFLPVYPEASMIGLSATGSAEAVHLLVRVAGESDPERRYLAVHALGLCAGSRELPEETRELVTRTLERVARGDSDPGIREKAAEWLSRPSQ